MGWWRRMWMKKLKCRGKVLIHRKQLGKNLKEVDLRKQSQRSKKPQ